MNTGVAYFGVCMTQQHCDELYMALTDWVLGQMGDPNSRFYSKAAAKKAPEENDDARLDTKEKVMKKEKKDQKDTEKKRASKGPGGGDNKRAKKHKSSSSCSSSVSGESGESK